MMRLLSVLALALSGCARPAATGAEGAAQDPTPTPATTAETAMKDTAKTPATTEIATFGAGCYWCTEAVLEQLDGVLDVTSGFMGGTVKEPTYRQVCGGDTGHAEVVQVTFDPKVISYDDLLAWFWRLHDPTTLNRQGADVGTQYRSVIFTHSEAQRQAALASKAAAQKDFRDPIVTEITPASTYYQADDYHQDYYRQNREQGYCRMVIAPKLGKLGLEK
jgi:peptide-methionine (S)-S-oxide reductase